MRINIFGVLLGTLTAFSVVPKPGQSRPFDPRGCANNEPSGGVEPTRESLTGWFNAGVACVGLGSQLVPGKLPDDFDYGTITEKAKNALAIVRELRGE